MLKIIKEERVNRILTIRDVFEPEGISAISEYAESIKKVNDYMVTHEVKISYDNYVKFLVEYCGLDRDQAIEEANEWIED